MKCIIRLYSKETDKHVNTMMLCGSGSGKFDSHDIYQWVSWPWGTIYPETFKTKDEALKFYDDKDHLYYEEMKGCIFTLIDKDGNYKSASQ